MESFEEQFSDHPAHNVLSQLGSRLQESSARELDEDATKYLDRIYQGFAFIQNRIAIASPVLATAAQLNRIQSSVQATLKEVNQFEGNGNTGHLANASNQLDAGITAAATLVALGQPNPEIKAEDAIAFKDVAGKVIKSLRDNVADVTSESDKLSGQLEQVEAGIEKQNKKLASLEAQITSKLEELQSLFSSAQSERQSTFEELINKLNKENTARLDALDTSTKEKIEYIDAKRMEAEHKVHLIGNIAVTGNFRLAASREGKLANIFRVVALVCFLCMVGVILYMGFVSLNEEFDLWLAVFRFAVGFAFLVPGVYAARESTRHRHLENKNRRAELELASIDNYLQSLPEDKRIEIKSELCVKYFGGDDSELGASEDVITTKSLFKLCSDLAMKLASK